MNKKNYKRSTFASAVVWFVFTILAWIGKYDLGTVATLGGISLMFAWMYEQVNITND